MRIPIVANLHFQATWYHWLMKQKADLMIITGI